MELEDILIHKKPRETHTKLVRRLLNEGKVQERDGKGLRLDASAADYFESNHNLQQAIIFDNPLDAIKYLIEIRDQLPKHNNKPLTLGFLIHSLYEGGKLDTSSLCGWQFRAGAADYVLEKQEIIEEEILRVICSLNDSEINSPNILENLVENVDKSKFTHRDNPNKLVSESYLHMILELAWELYN